MNAIKSIFAILILIVSTPVYASEENTLQIENITCIFTYDPVTGAKIDTQTDTYSPIIVIELAEGESSTEKYARSPVVVKGKMGDRYKVVVTATWVDQVVSSEMKIPSSPPTYELAYPYGRMVQKRIFQK